MDQIRQRLLLSLNRAMENASKGMQVGNCEQVTLDPDVIEEFKVSSLARFVKNGDEYSVHAGPARIDRTTWWNSHVDDHVDDVIALVKGKNVDLGRQRKDPRVDYEKGGTGIPDAYEVKLLEKLSHQPFTLVNPAKGTLFRVPITHNTLNVCLTNNVTNRRQEVLDVCGKQKLKVNFTKEVIGIAYLGSNGVQDVCPTKWCALVPNPYITPFPYNNFSVQVTDFGVTMAYDRTERRVNTALRFFPSCFRYSPDQVDEEFYYSKFGKATKGHYFFETSEESTFRPSRFETEKVRYMKKYIRRNELGFAEDKTFVYDVPGTDTYLSRYPRVVEYAKQQGKKAVTLYSTHEKYGVSLSSDVPSLSVISFVREINECKIIQVGNRYNEGVIESNSYVRVYSPTFSRTDVPFPEGGEIRVPFCHDTKTYSFMPEVPGVYFVMSVGCTSQDYFYQIMNELYSTRIESYRVHTKFSSETIDRKTSVIQELIKLPEVMRWGEHGISAVELAKKMNVSANSVFPLTRHVQGVYWYTEVKDGKVITYYAHISRLKEVLWSGLTYGALMMNWHLDPKLVVPNEFADRVMSFFRMQGLPVVKVRYKEGHIVVQGIIDAYARMRFLM